MDDTDGRVANVAVKPIVRSHQHDMGNLGSITVTNQSPPAPTVSVFGGDTTVTLQMSVANYPDVTDYRVIKSDRAVVYDGSEDTFTISQDGETYTVYAYNAWESVSSGMSTVAMAPAGRETAAVQHRH
ncbi:hypothetical protein [Paraburkholderia sp. ZP32-5]|uniref:hypothetical protein n=1 Tax=Paraburkholderia sp. ZP32-5 TaxID=2883245 RepID=UPI001F421319|nr:hypothetical protein [Paraburkholderia sp. ZP32-5]